MQLRALRAQLGGAHILRKRNVHARHYVARAADYGPQSGISILLVHIQCVFVIELIAIIFHNLIQFKINHLHRSDNLVHFLFFLQLFVNWNSIKNQSSIQNLKNRVTSWREVQFVKNMMSLCSF